jgi:hypothetical protein
VFLILLHKKAPFSSCSSSELNFTVLLLDQPYIEIILDNGGESNGVEDPQAARLRELVDYVQAQGASAGSEVLASPAVSVECILEELELRVRRLEKLQVVNSVLWTFFMSAFVGYLLYQRSRHSHS